MTFAIESPYTALGIALILQATGYEDTKRASRSNACGDPNKVLKTPQDQHRVMLVVME